jgi:hypothetical protein
MHSQSLTPKVRKPLRREPPNLISVAYAAGYMGSIYHDADYWFLRAVITRLEAKAPAYTPEAGWKPRVVAVRVPLVLFSHE